jgi:acetyl-CoA carboxylase biotin carboxyl carrier protein
MNLDEIRQLIQLAQETGVMELEVQRADNRVRVRLGAVNYEAVVAPLPSAVSQPAGAARNNDSGPVDIQGQDYASDPNVVLVKSPIVGTFYESPSPGAAPFVRVGDSISQGRVICIIESMKLMNEIECEHSGTLVAKLVENGHAVEYGEALFAIRTA